jgi:hypothetical protein
MTQDLFDFYVTREYSKYSVVEFNSYRWTDDGFTFFCGQWIVSRCLVTVVPLVFGSNPSLYEITPYVENQLHFFEPQKFTVNVLDPLHLDDILRQLVVKMNINVSYAKARSTSSSRGFETSYVLCYGKFSSYYVIHHKDLWATTFTKDLTALVGDIGKTFRVLVELDNSVLGRLLLDSPLLGSQINDPPCTVVSIGSSTRQWMEVIDSSNRCQNASWSQVQTGKDNGLFEKVLRIAHRKCKSFRFGDIVSIRHAEKSSTGGATYAYYFLNIKFKDFSRLSFLLQVCGCYSRVINDMVKVVLEYAE